MHAGKSSSEKQQQRRTTDSGKGGSHGNPHYQHPTSPEAWLSASCVAKNCLVGEGMHGKRVDVDTVWLHVILIIGYDDLFERSLVTRSLISIECAVNPGGWS